MNKTDSVQDMPLKAVEHKELNTDEILGGLVSYWGCGDQECKDKARQYMQTILKSATERAEVEGAIKEVKQQLATYSQVSSMLDRAPGGTESYTQRTIERFIKDLQEREAELQERLHTISKAREEKQE